MVSPISGLVMELRLIFIVSDTVPQPLVTDAIYLPGWVTVTFVVLANATLSFVQLALGLEPAESDNENDAAQIAVSRPRLNAFGF